MFVNLIFRCEAELKAVYAGRERARRQEGTCGSCSDSQKRKGSDVTRVDL